MSVCWPAEREEGTRVGLVPIAQAELCLAAVGAYGAQPPILEGYLAPMFTEGYCKPVAGARDQARARRTARRSVRLFSLMQRR
jgi:hypothetical protein